MPVTRSNPSDVPLQRRGPMSHRAWPVAIAFILIASAGANLWLMIKAKADASFAVEPNYYEQAVAWDARMSEEQAARDLGWRASATVRLSAESVGALEIRLVDRDGAPISKATVTAEVFHNARADQRLAVTLVELAEGGGRYRTVLDVSRAGVWEVRLRASKGGARFIQTLRVIA